MADRCGTDNRRSRAVDAAVYDGRWVEEMGGAGSDRAFRATRGKILRPRLSYALGLAGLASGMAVLDIGCGRGEVVFKAWEAGARVAAGIDYAPASLGRARKNLTDLAGPGQRWGLTQADAKRLPFTADAFDRILLLDVVEHLHEWELQEVWGELHRVLRRDGLVVIHTLPNRWAMDIGYRLARAIVPGMPRTAPDKRDLFHVNEQTVPTLARSLAQGGFRGRVWLHDLSLRQARFLEENDLGSEPELAGLYRRLRSPLWGALYALLARLPSRLALVTDLFALAWKPGHAPLLPGGLPAGWIERLLSRLEGLRT